MFITLGAISTSVGQLLARYKHSLAQVAGVVIILFGLHLTGLLRIRALYADKRLHSVRAGPQYGDLLSSVLPLPLGGRHAWDRSWL